MSYDWKKTCVEQSCTVRDVLKKIDGEALRTALVVDDKMNLQGVVTDGDVRRYILKDGGLDDSVSEVMSRNFISVTEGTSREELIELMESRSILSIPVLDGQRVVGLETLHQILSRPKLANPVFIMAGGFGTRLRPLTDNCPKPMLKVGDKPILETLIRSFMKAGFVNFYISTHFMPEIIRGHFGDGSQMGINITYVHEEEPLGTGGALGLLPDNLPRDMPLIMINGDVLTTVDFQRLLDFHLENDGDATVCVREYDYQIPYGVINGEGNKITSMVEKPVQRFFVNAGIYVVSPRVFESVPKNQ